MPRTTAILSFTLLAISIAAVIGGYALFTNQQQPDSPPEPDVADRGEIAEATPLDPKKQTTEAEITPTPTAQCVAGTCAAHPTAPLIDDDDDDDDDDSDDDEDDEEEPCCQSLGTAACTTCPKTTKTATTDAACANKPDCKAKEKPKDQPWPEDAGIWAVEGWTLKLRGGAFFPMSRRFREAYRTVAPNVQVEASVKFTGDPFSVWANVDSFFQRGSHRHPFGCQRVGNMVNISAGLKFSRRVIGEVETYFGLGPSLGWLDIWFDNSRPCTNLSFTRWAVGGVLKSGIYLYLTPTIFMDFYLDYLYQPVHWQNIDIDVGGLKSGIGLGVSF